VRMGERAAVVQVVGCWEASVTFDPERAAGARLSLAGQRTRPRASAQGRALPWPLASSIGSVFGRPNGSRRRCIGRVAARCARVG
jgi:hypothetical protein